jgi:acyl-CoA synthetase (AMP-forming)/AMP-acid ligase II
MNTRRQLTIEDWLGPLLLALLISFLGCLASGCVSAKANSQKTLAGIQYAKDAAMKTWGAYVAREQRRADALPEGDRQQAHAQLLQRRRAVDDALTKFSAAWQAAFTAAQYDTAQPPTAQSVALLADLQTAIKAFAP